MLADRDELIRAKINDLGRKSFPDDPDVLWQVRSIVHAEKYSFVEAEPNPATLGYPKFMFVLSFAGNAEPGVVGCYCFDRGLWSLLFTTPNTPSDWIGLFPAENSVGLEADLLPLLQEGKKIEAIKVYREKTGAGLREAKDSVEALARKHGLAMSKPGCAGLIVLLSAALMCLVSLFASTASPQSVRGSGLGRADSRPRDKLGRRERRQCVVGVDALEVNRFGVDGFASVLQPRTGAGEGRRPGR